MLFEPELCAHCKSVVSAVVYAQKAITQFEVPGSVQQLRRAPPARPCPGASEACFMSKAFEALKKCENIILAEQQYLSRRTHEHVYYQKVVKGLMNYEVHEKIEKIQFLKLCYYEQLVRLSRRVPTIEQHLTDIWQVLTRMLPRCCRTTRKINSAKVFRLSLERCKSAQIFQLSKQQKYNIPHNEFFLANIRFDAAGNKPSNFIIPRNRCIT